jgi:hypothetical protein
VERTVTKAGPNHGRRIHFCGKQGDDGGSSASGGCEYIRMFPLCDCGGSAIVLVSQSAANPGKAYYCCYKKQRRNRYGACDFFEWK